jgi:sugar phosphate isomerase/epimerase
MTNQRHEHSRRVFLARMAAAAPAMMMLGAAASPAPSNPPRKYRIGGFTKPFQILGFEETADLVAQVGWEGIECPVRAGGQVLPERAGEDLPRLAEALKKRNLEIFTIATDIRNASNPLTEKVLRAAAGVGVKIYRLASLKYDLRRPLEPQMAEFKAGFKELQALNRELGMCAAYENHSGADLFGAAIWDVSEVMKDWDPKEYGICYDSGHAVIEGGLDWRIQYELIKSRISALYVKDFVWRKNGDRWSDQWCPFGEGLVTRRFFDGIRNSSFSGPVIQHLEYPAAPGLKYPVAGGKELIEALKHDREVMEQWLAA